MKNLFHTYTHAEAQAAMKGFAGVAGSLLIAVLTEIGQDNLTGIPWLIYQVVACAALLFFLFYFINWFSKAGKCRKEAEQAMKKPMRAENEDSVRN